MNNRVTPIGVSNRHVHLKEESIQTLFWKDSLDIMKDLSQPGQFAAHQLVDILGPEKIPGNESSRKIITWVRVLWPARSADQVELSITDARTIGIKNIPIRLSGVLSETPGIIMRGPAGQIEIQEWVIIAHKHLHIEPRRAQERGLSNWENIVVGTQNQERGGLLTNVIVRVSPEAALDLHIDTDEGNAFNITTWQEGIILQEHEILDYIKKHNII